MATPNDVYSYGQTRYNNLRNQFANPNQKKDQNQQMANNPLQGDIGFQAGNLIGTAINNGIQKRNDGMFNGIDVSMFPQKGSDASKAVGLNNMLTKGSKEDIANLAELFGKTGM